MCLNLSWCLSFYFDFLVTNNETHVKISGQNKKVSFKLYFIHMKNILGTLVFVIIHMYFHYRLDETRKGK